MAATVQTAIDRTQEILQDTAGIRYTVASLIAYYNEALLIARRVRPDLFVYTYAAAPAQAGATSDPFLMPESYVEMVSNYMASRAELRDDEFAVDGRAMALRGAWQKALVEGL